MSDEEKKAINQLKADTSFYDYELKNGNYIYELFKIEVYKKNVDVILNLIEKQSKEIEELKKHQITFTNDYKPIGSNGRRFISEDKIKAKIEYNKTFNDDIHKYTTLTLEELLDKE